MYQNLSDYFLSAGNPELNMLPCPRFCRKSKDILCFFGFPLLEFSEYKAFQSDLKK